MSPIPRLWTLAWRRCGRLGAQLEVSSSKKARKGDSVVIDFEGFIGDTAFAGGKGEDYQLELGSGSFIPGFEDQAIGMQREESRDIEVAFPDDYGQAELAGKPAVFKVVLKEIKEKVVPELDDEFAKGFGVESLADLREQLQKSYETQETNRVENDLREKLVSTLIERNPIEVPEAMIASQLDYMSREHQLPHAVAGDVSGNARDHSGKFPRKLSQYSS